MKTVLELKEQFNKQRTKLEGLKQEKSWSGDESDSDFKKRVSAETREMDILAGKMKDLEEKYGKDVLKGNAARGGFIVNQPTYLPNSGVVVGEHGTYSGRGAAAGGIADGGPEAVIPLSSSRAGAFIDPMARSVAGAVMNQLQMERGMMSGGGSDASVVTGNDMSNNQVSNNTTVINNPSPIGQTLPDEGRDFVSKVA